MSNLVNSYPFNKKFGRPIAIWDNNGYGRDLEVEILDFVFNSNRQTIQAVCVIKDGYYKNELRPIDLSNLKIKDD
jgi:hypothetical protein